MYLKLLSIDEVFLCKSFLKTMTISDQHMRDNNVFVKNLSPCFQELSYAIYLDNTDQSYLHQRFNGRYKLSKSRVSVRLVP